jgi:signal transduction histidine kinase
VTVAREFDPLPAVSVDRHKVLQILVNLLSNAKYACDAADKNDRRVTVRIRKVREERVQIEVADNGEGIAPENLTRIFTLGFTTRKDGHGFGLHSAALTSRELGGSLSAHSDGPGWGATFTLEFPLAQATDSREKA